MIYLIIHKLASSLSSLKKIQISLLLWYGNTLFRESNTAAFSHTKYKLWCVEHVTVEFWFNLTMP